MVDVPLTPPGEPIQLRGATSVGSLFDVLAVEPAAGRTFTAGEDVPGGDRIVVLSHRLANRLFGMVVPSLRTLKVDPAEVPKGE